MRAPCSGSARAAYRRETLQLPRRPAGLPYGQHGLARVTLNLTKPPLNRDTNTPSKHGLADTETGGFPLGGATSLTNRHPTTARPEKSTQISHIRTRKLRQLQLLPPLLPPLLAHTLCKIFILSISISICCILHLLCLSLCLPRIRPRAHAISIVGYVSHTCAEVRGAARGHTALPTLHTHVTGT